MFYMFYVSDDEEEEEEGESEASGCVYHTVVLDCAPITFVDSTGISRSNVVHACIR